MEGVMRNLKGTYVHRGDVARRTRRIRQTLLVLGLFVATGVIAATRKTSTADAEPTPNTSRASIFALPGERRLRNDLANLQGQLDLLQGQYDRANAVIKYSTRFDISAGLSSSVFDAAIAEGIDPELAFRLVRLESGFNTHAMSSTGAIGHTQLMPSTARLFKSDVSRDDLYDKDVNLKIGFRYLRNLLKLYKGDVELALTAYNRGEDAVDRALKLGINPRNGYDRSVMGNYRGKGIIQ
jgi:soluble lytic murein transglycosylase-like protein